MEVKLFNTLKFSKKNRAILSVLAKRTHDEMAKEFVSLKSQINNAQHAVHCGLKKYLIITCDKQKGYNAVQHLSTYECINLQVRQINRSSYKNFTTNTYAIFMYTFLPTAVIYAWFSMTDSVSILV